MIIFYHFEIINKILEGLLLLPTVDTIINLHLGEYNGCIFFKDNVK